MKSRKIRYALLALMLVLTACSVLLVPKISINEDMTRYLPDDSSMKHGVDTLKRYFPEVDMNAYYVKAMFKTPVDSAARAMELTDIDGIEGITAVYSNAGHTMFQLAVSEGADTKAVAAAISGRYGDVVVVEHNANSIMPDNMSLILIIGVAIVFGILFLMCSSIVEALLFIFTICMAVILNMGTNAFLPSVSMLTNTIVAVLQLVLSMDYSIILMNRFRQVNDAEPDIDKAMGLAVKSASPSILSSSFTTIVGLLALVFMKFKIGLDLGVVLAKGVLFSLISIYTILPALILLFHKGIVRTEKKVFLIPTDRLARFELRARVPLAILFVVIFGASWYLSRKTELSYASIWESRINEEFPPQNQFSLLYRTSVEDGAIALTDTLNSREKVFMALSYPSLFKKELTAGEMCGNIHSLLALLPNMPGAGTTVIPDFTSASGMLTPEAMKMLYYVASHPERDERMSFEDMLHLAEEASEYGLLPEGMDVDSMIAGFTIPSDESQLQAVPEAVVENEIQAVETPVLDTPDEKAKAVEENPVSGGGSLAELARPTVDESGEDPYKLQGKYSFTKEKLNTPMNSIEMSDYLGFSRGQASAAYSMARKKNGTMTPYEFINYMIDKVLGNKLLRRMISDKQAEGLYFIRDEMDAVLSAADIPAAEPSEKPVSIAIEEHAANELEAVAEPSVQAAEPASASTVQSTPEYTPMDRLAEMYASGRKYTSKQIYRSLHDAGIDVVDKGMIDLMAAFYGSRNNFSDSTCMTLDGIIDFISDEVATGEMYSSFIDDSTRAMLGGLRGMVDDGMKMLRKEGWSMAAVVTEYPLESEETFDFIEDTISGCEKAFGDGNYFLIGESVMYKEMKDGFKRELLFLTLLTIVSIFLIVAVTFRSLLIPAILVMSVMSGVFLNVFFSGFGGNTMLYLAYLIVQSILMGATIDYGILFTNYYLGFRRKGQSKADALAHAYRGSIHTIMTSGLIIIFAPFIMSELLTDPTICSILSSLTLGALSSISLILFVLPALLASCDRIITRLKDF